MSGFVCTTTDVLGYGCICARNGWGHEWGPAFPVVESRPGLHWCANCDCCVADMEPPPSITCPRCGRTSYNANDIREGYCAFCHDWTKQ